MISHIILSYIWNILNLERGRVFAARIWRQLNFPSRKIAERLSSTKTVYLWAAKDGILIYNIYDLDIFNTFSLRRGMVNVSVEATRSRRSRSFPLFLLISCDNDTPRG